MCNQSQFWSKRCCGGSSYSCRERASKSRCEISHFFWVKDGVVISESFRVRHVLNDIVNFNSCRVRGAVKVVVKFFTVVE